MVIGAVAIASNCIREKIMELHLLPVHYKKSVELD